MKKIIILLLALLMSACSAVKPAETLSSMQTEATAETTVAETTAPEETMESTSEETEAVIEAPKEDPTAPSDDERPEQKSVPETSTVTIAETPVEPINTETTPEPPKTQETHAETVPYLAYLIHLYQKMSALSHCRSPPSISSVFT